MPFIPTSIFILLFIYSLGFSPCNGLYVLGIELRYIVADVRKAVNTGFSSSIFYQIKGKLFLLVHQTSCTSSKSLIILKMIYI